MSDFVHVQDGQVWRMKGTNLYVTASLNLIRMLNGGLDHLKKRCEAYYHRVICEQSWKVLGALGAAHMEEVHGGLMSPVHEAERGVVDLATRYNAIAEGGTFHRAVHLAQSYQEWRRSEEEANLKYQQWLETNPSESDTPPEGCISYGCSMEYTEGGDAIVTFGISVSLAKRWVGALVENLGGGMRDYCGKVIPSIPLATLLQQADSYEAWLLDAVRAKGSVADFLAVCCSDSYLVTNTMIEHGLIESCEQLQQLSLQDRENIPDWLLELLSYADMTKP